MEGEDKPGRFVLLAKGGLAHCNLLTFAISAPVSLSLTSGPCLIEGSEGSVQYHGWGEGG